MRATPDYDLFTTSEFCKRLFSLSLDLEVSDHQMPTSQTHIGHVTGTEINNTGASVVP